MTDTPAAPLLAPATDAGDMRKVGWIPYTGSPPPHWTPEDRYDRRPKRAEDWDYRNDTPETRKDLVERRLNFAGDLADPRVELEMTIVHRTDLMDVTGELIWRRAQVESLRNRLALQPSYRQGLEDAWQPIETAPKEARPIDLWGQERERYAPERIINCYWHESGRWVHPRTIHDDETDDELAQVYNPTHWRLPPEPPAIRALGAG